MAGVLVVAGAVLYSTVRGYMTWYFRVNGQVTVNGQKTTGYMHANYDRTVLLVTRTDGSKAETYLVPVSDSKPISDCGEWHPVRFLPFPMGDVSPPCTVHAVDPAKVVDAPVAATVIRKRRSVEFSTASGKKVRAEW